MAAVTALCWAYLLKGPVSGAAPPGSAHGLAVALPLWAVMMTGMMLPSTAPMLFAYAQVSRRDASGHLARTLAFILAYLGLWVLASALGALAQTGLQAAGVLSHLGASTLPALSGGLLLVAGAYQLSPLKQACLRGCRTPMGFLLTEWRPGARGALVMGARHGAECILCCWALMALCFVLGTMNLLWMGILTLIMLVEKTFPGGRRVGIVAGWAFLAWGAWVLLESLV